MGRRSIYWISTSLKVLYHSKINTQYSLAILSYQIHRMIAELFLHGNAIIQNNNVQFNTTYANIVTGWQEEISCGSEVFIWPS